MNMTIIGHLRLKRSNARQNWVATHCSVRIPLPKLGLRVAKMRQMVMGRPQWRTLTSFIRIKRCQLRIKKTQKNKKWSVRVKISLQRVKSRPIRRLTPPKVRCVIHLPSSTSQKVPAWPQRRQQAPRWAWSGTRGTKMV